LEEDSRFKDVVRQLTEEHVEAVNDEGVTVEADAPLIKLVNQDHRRRVQDARIDIHLEPLATRFRCGTRIDGMMHEMKRLPNGCSLPSSRD